MTQVRTEARRAYERAYYKAHPKRKTDRHVKPLEKPQPRFVALDGEGEDNPDGSHKYVLLASSTGENIQGWITGLNTVECLEFILSQHKRGTTLVSFAFSYDVNMLLGFLPRDAVKTLWETGECEYMHFHLKFAQGKFFAILDRLSRKPKFVTVWDAFGFFQKSFVGALQEWLPDEKETIAIIKGMKDKRGEFNLEQMADIIKYCHKECDLLVEMMNRLAGALWKLGIYLRSWHGAGAIAGYMLNKTGVQKSLAWESLGDGVRNASLWAYFGGRIEVFRQGIINPLIYDYDIISAYPAAMVQFPRLRDGQWTFVPGKYYDRFMHHPYTLWEVSWNIPNWHSHYFMAPFPQHIEDGGVYWLSYGHGWYHGVEVQAAKQIFGEHITVNMGYVFEPATDEKPFAWIKNIFDERLAYKQQGDPRHIPLKLGLNSLYGKLAQGVMRGMRQKPPFQNFYLAGLTTASTRAKLLHVGRMIGRTHLLAFATDGVFSTANMKHSNIPFNEGLGTWEMSTIDSPLLIVQPGVMFTRDRNFIKSRGFGKSSISFDELAFLWNKKGTRGEATYKERRFIGMGSCYVRGHYDEWRRWMPVERHISFDLGNKKIPDFSLGNGYLLPGVAYKEARSYRPRGRVVDEVARNPTAESEYISLLEQPDIDLGGDEG